MLACVCVCRALRLCHCDQPPAPTPAAFLSSRAPRGRPLLCTTWSRGTPCLHWGPPVRSTCVHVCTRLGTGREAWGFVIRLSQSPVWHRDTQSSSVLHTVPARRACVNVAAGFDFRLPVTCGFFFPCPPRFRYILTPDCLFGCCWRAPQAVNAPPKTEAQGCQSAVQGAGCTVVAGAAIPVSVLHPRPRAHSHAHVLARAHVPLHKHAHFHDDVLLPSQL